MKLEQKYK